jgi:hypothetical protein
MYGIGAGGALTTTSAIVLPDTGSNKLLTIFSLACFALGVILIATATAKVVAERRFNTAK